MTTSAQGRPQSHTSTVLFITAGAVVLIALASALFAAVFPGAPPVAGATCDAPGAAGCTRTQTRTFTAALVGGPSALILVIAAFVSLAGSSSTGPDS